MNTPVFQYLSCTKYKLRITFVESVLGTQPDSEIARRYLEAKAVEKDPSLAANIAEEQETLPEFMERQTTCFYRDRAGKALVLDYQVRGFLKETALTLNGKKCVGEIKNLRSKITNLVFAWPRRNYLIAPQEDVTFEQRRVTVRQNGTAKEMLYVDAVRDGLTVTSDAIPVDAEWPADWQRHLERPLKGQTAQGPRIALARSEQMPPGTTFTTELWVVEDLIPEKVLRALLEYGRLQGMLQWRTGSHGRFLHSLEKLS